MVDKMRAGVMMGQKYQRWAARHGEVPRNLDDLTRIIVENRRFKFRQGLSYGDYGLQQVQNALEQARGSVQVYLHH